MQNPMIQPPTPMVIFRMFSNTVQSYNFFLIYANKKRKIVQNKRALNNFFKEIAHFVSKNLHISKKSSTFAAAKGLRKQCKLLN